MDDPTLHQEREAALAIALRSLWEQAYGVPAGKVRVLMGHDSVAALIEDILTPAERTATQRAESQQLLQRYTEQILNLIEPELRTRVESIIGHQTISASVYVDTVTGRVICFYILGEPLVSEPIHQVSAPTAL